MIAVAAPIVLAVVAPVSAATVTVYGHSGATGNYGGARDR